MKFKDINKFIQCDERIMVPIRDLFFFIDKYKKDYNLNLMPDFQRGHVWNEKQQTKYIEFLLKGGTSGREIYLNCPGWNKKFDGQMVLVDGLQRLTAITKFLNNQIYIFDRFSFTDFEDKIPHYYSIFFNINNLEKESEVLNWYIELNSGGIIHTDEELDRVYELLKKTKRKERDLIYMKKVKKKKD